MPWLPKVPCVYPGCPNLCDVGNRCKVHIKVLTKDHTGRHDSTRWLKYRKYYLSLHPLCVYCQREGKLVPSKVVDHKLRVDSDLDPLFWDDNNHQALCVRCHNIKSRREQAEVVW